MTDSDPKSGAPPRPLQSDLRDLGPAPSGRRPAAHEPAPGWLQALLELATELPVHAGLRPVARDAAACLAALLPGRAVGLCIAATPEEQIVETRVPSGVSSAPAHDPSRLFAGLPFERVFDLEDGLVGSTLHIAAADEPVLRDEALESSIVERFAQVTSGALARARAFSDAVDANRELRRLQAQVIQAEKLASLGQIVAGVVHELNNPLTSIVAYSDYLLRRSMERGADAEDVERLRRIVEAAERILKFSRDLVAYARPSSEVAGPVHLHEVIDKALVFCEHEFGERGVSIERRLGADLPPVLGIAGQLTQVFVNLFTNASHAMHGGGGRLRVESRAEIETECVVVEVSDDGVGIDPNDLCRIFEPFFTTKTDGRGTGLGLSIVRDIVDAHGGRLVCRSEPGNGATFVLTLPAVPSKKTTRPPPAL